MSVSLTRRSVIGASAATVAAVPPLALPANAVMQDAELLRLWAEYKAAWNAWSVAWTAMSAAQKKADAETEPLWSWIAGIGSCVKSGAPFAATFGRFEQGEPIYQVVALAAKTMGEAYDAAQQHETALRNQYQCSQKAAEKRHRVSALECAERKGNGKVEDTTGFIAETPAQGLSGLAVKLAVCMREKDFMPSLVESLRPSFPAHGNGPLGGDSAMVEASTSLTESTATQRWYGRPALPVTFAAASVAARDYAQASKAPSTRRAYQTDAADFAAWCRVHSAEPLPASVCLSRLTSGIRPKGLNNHPPVCRHPLHASVGRPRVASRQ